MTGTKVGRSGFSTALLLLICPLLLVIFLAVCTGASQQSRTLLGLAARRRAACLADAGFEWAAARLARGTDAANRRWYRADGKEHGRLHRRLDQGQIDVFAADVFNAFGELDGVFLLARGTSSAGGWRRVAVATFGFVRLLRSADGSLVATPLDRERLNPNRLARLYGACPEPFAAKTNPYVARRLLDIDEATYASAVGDVVTRLGEGRVETLDFSDDGRLRCLACLLMRCLQIRRLRRVAEVFAAPRGPDDRRKTLASLDALVLRDAPTTEQIRQLSRRLEAVGSQAALSAERAEDLLCTMQRPLRELAVVRLLLEDLTALGGSARIHGKDGTKTPAQVALSLARALYESVTGAGALGSDVGAVFASLYRKKGRLRQVNVLNRLYYAIEKDATLATVKTGETAGAESPAVHLRSLLFAWVRAYPVDPSRIPGFRNAPEELFRQATGAGSTGGDTKGRVTTLDDYRFQRAVSALPPSYAREYQGEYRLLQSHFNDYLFAQYRARGLDGYAHAQALAGQVGVVKGQQLVLWHVLLAHARLCWVEDRIDVAFDDPADDPVPVALAAAARAMDEAALASARLEDDALSAIEDAPAAARSEDLPSTASASPAD